MSAFSDYLEPLLGYHALGKTTLTPAATLTVKLYTAAPGDTGGGTEVTGGSYAAVSVTNNTTNFPTCSAAGTPTKTNGAVIQFPTASAAWGTVTHWAIYAGSDLLVYGPMATARYVASGDAPKIAIGALSIAFSNTAAGGLTAEIRRRLLDLVFGQTSYTKPDAVYAGCGTTLSDEDLTPSEDATYSRQAITFDTATAGAIPSLGVQTVISSATSGETLTCFGIWDDATSGTLIAAGPVATPRAPGDGDSVQFAAGSVVVTIQ